jgi:long-chain acyl-CoA synthetase
MSADAGDVFTVAYYQSADGQLRGARLTHQNITAGVAAIRSLIPISNVISSLDTIVSAHSLSTPFGRAVAYTALYENTSFATLKSAKVYRLSGELQILTSF